MLTANNILVNPIHGSSHIAPRSLIINALTLQTQMKQIHLVSVRKTSNKDIIVHLKLKSDSIQNLFYDVMFEFFNTQLIKGDSIIDGVFKDKTEMNVFSNSPEFVFTYAYAFNKKNYLINKYKSFLGHKALTEAPKIKNPSSDVGISTSLFFCLKYLDNINFFGNYNYVKFLNNLDTRPLTYHQIEKVTNDLKRKEQAFKKHKFKK